MLHVRNSYLHLPLNGAIFHPMHLNNTFMEHLDYLSGYIRQLFNPHTWTHTHTQKKKSAGKFFVAHFGLQKMEPDTPSWMKSAFDFWPHDPPSWRLMRPAVLGPYILCEIIWWLVQQQKLDVGGGLLCWPSNKYTNCHKNSPGLKIQVAVSSFNHKGSLSVIHIYIYNWWIVCCLFVWLVPWLFGWLFVWLFVCHFLWCVRFLLICCLFLFVW